MSKHVFSIRSAIFMTLSIKKKVETRRQGDVQKSI